MLKRAAFTRVQRRMCSGKMGWAYRVMRLHYYKPSFVEVNSTEGLIDLTKHESNKKLVVVIHHSSDMLEIKGNVASAAEERILSEFNNRVVYAFSNVSHDTTLPCSPVIDIYAKGKLVQRTLGCSLSPLLCVPHLTLKHKFEGSYDAEEIVPSELYFGIPRSMYSRLFKKLQNVPDNKANDVINRAREEVVKYKLNKA